MGGSTLLATRWLWSMLLASLCSESIFCHLALPMKKWKEASVNLRRRCLEGAAPVMPCALRWADRFSHTDVVFLPQRWYCELTPLMQRKSSVSHGSTLTTTKWQPQRSVPSTVSRSTTIFAVQRACTATKLIESSVLKYVQSLYRLRTSGVMSA